MWSPFSSAGHHITRINRVIEQIVDDSAIEMCLLRALESSGLCSFSEGGLIFRVNTYR